MNTCIKCGCDDAYPSLPPCPTPVDCPNPQPCAEFFDAQCVIYTLPDIMCGLNIVVAQDSSIAAALESIVLFFCTNFSNSVQSVTGLNTDNTDPLNPIVKVSVDGITITGLGTPASPLIAVAGGVDGSGTLNYVAKWTPDGNTLGNSLIRDDGTNIGVGTAPLANYTFRVVTTTNPYALTGANSFTSGGAGLFGVANGITGNTNYGGYFSALSSTLVNIGGYGDASQPTVGKNIGLVGNAFNGVTNYAIKLIDGSEGIGKVLTCMTTDGEANWVTPSGGGVGGSGIKDYIARWTPDGVTLGTGLIQDDGISASIGVPPDSTIQLYVVTSKTNGVAAVTSKISGNNTGMYGEANGVGASQNLGVSGLASGGTVVNTGVYGESNGVGVTGYGGRFLSNLATTENVGVFASAGGGATAIGGQFNASGAGPNTYSLKLTDGTEGVNKVLTCMTATGEANWVTPSSGGGLTWSTITGPSPVVTLAANNGYVIRDTTGAFTSLTLPSSGVVVGDIIKISATTEGGGGTLSTWQILEGRVLDVIFYSFYDPAALLEYTGVLNTSPLLIFDDTASIGSNVLFKNQSLTLTCVQDLGTAYAWNIELANGKMIG